MDTFIENNFNGSKSILVIDDSKELCSFVKDIFKNDYYNFISSNSNFDSIDQYLEESIHIILINADDLKNDLLDITNRIKINASNRGIPIMVFSSNSQMDFQIKVLKNAEYYITKPINKVYCQEVLTNISNLIDVNKSTSAVSGLPGCSQINIELKNRIHTKKPFVIMYIDLDHFKEYNDSYGFINGNNVILSVANLIENSVKEYGENESFIGHIGGDDFIIILNPENADMIADKILDLFAKSLINYYDVDDLNRGYVNTLNRQGVMDNIPIMSLSIAFVYKKFNTIESNMEFLSTIISTKKKAKSINGNSIFKTEV